MARFRLFLEKVNRFYEKHDRWITIILFSLGLIAIALPIINPALTLISLIPIFFILCVFLPHVVLKFAAQRFGSSIPPCIPSEKPSTPQSLRFVTSAEIHELAEMAHEAFSHSSELSVDQRTQIYSEWHSSFPQGFLWITLPGSPDGAEQEIRVGFSIVIPVKAEFYKTYFRSGIKSFDQFSGNDLETQQARPACLLIEGVYLLPRFHKSHQGLGVSMLFSHLRYLMKKQRLYKPLIATEPVNAPIHKMLNKIGICKVATTKDSGDLYELDLSSNLSPSQRSFAKRHLIVSKSKQRRKRNSKPTLRPNRVGGGI